MNSNKNQIELELMSIDEYVWKSFANYVEQEGANLKEGEEKQVRYNWITETKNRNREQVPDEIFRQILLNHQHYFIYN